MTIEEIKHLGTLSRLSLTNDEVVAFAGEIDAIVAYVGVLSNIAGDKAPKKSLGVRYNVMRPDQVLNQGEQYTETLLSAAPKRVGRFVMVKKIIDQSS